jgi:N-hydroxyarylamine O-acetyltransferase
MFDLDAYLARIGHAGPRAPTLATLQAIHALHPRAIAFENLDPLAGRAVDLDAAALQRKLVGGGRGGWCFEHNLLLRHALHALGFRVTGLAARVVWNAAPGAPPPRSHMLLRVELDGATYVADAGFGGLTLTAPLRLAHDVVQDTPHEPARLLERDGVWELQCRVGDAWQPLYRFDLHPQLDADYEVSNWYLAHHPKSRFVTGLLAARAADGVRYALADNVRSVYRLDGSRERTRLDSAAAIRDSLERDFLVTVPAGSDYEAALARIAAR